MSTRRKSSSGDPRRRPSSARSPNLVVDLRRNRQERVSLSCRPVDPHDYPPDRLRLWNELTARQGYDFPVYPGSSEDVCGACGVPVLIGPRQSIQLVEFGRRQVAIFCHLCAIAQQGLERIAGQPPGVALSLGNPEGDLDPDDRPSTIADL